MIDNYAIFSIFTRLLAEVIFVVLVIQQLQVLFSRGKTKYLQVVLLIALVMLALGNGFSLGLNFFRQEDGNLQEAARHAGMVLNGLATLGAAIALYLINKFKLK